MNLCFFDALKHRDLSMLLDTPKLQESITRMRRLRSHHLLRNLVRETTLDKQDLVLPLFIKGIVGEKQPIMSMPGHYQIPLVKLEQEIQELLELGIQSVILFGVPLYKDAVGSDSCHDHGIIQQAVRKIKSITKELLVMCDVCLCEYTDHGHCGIMKQKAEDFFLHNDETLEILRKQALSLAYSGADVLAPSGMIDHMVAAIRGELDCHGFEEVPILSYSVKYHSSLYGPFRMAAEGAPSFGDRSTHQMDVANVAEALREALCDFQEGADMLMVKPAHTYLDVIAKIKKQFPFMPLGAYHTSGEFGMIKAAAEKGWLDEKKGALEVLTAIKRAGADFIISYYTKEAAVKGWV